MADGTDRILNVNNRSVTVKINVQLMGLRGGRMKGVPGSRSNASGREINPASRNIQNGLQASRGIHGNNMSELTATIRTPMTQGKISSVISGPQKQISGDHQTSAA